MSVITLCLLSEEYELAYQIIISFSEVEVNESILSEIAQLITVLETPVFICNINQYLSFKIIIIGVWISSFFNEVFVRLNDAFTIRICLQHSEVKIEKCVKYLNLFFTTG